MEYFDKVADSKVEERDKSEQGEVDDQAMELGIPQWGILTRQ